MSKSLLNGAILSALLLATHTRSSFAATLVDQVNIPAFTATSATTTMPLAVTVPQFDPSLGQLTGVTLELKLPTQVGLSISGTSASSAPYSLSVAPAAFPFNNFGLSVIQPSDATFPSYPTSGLVISTAANIAVTANTYNGNSPVVGSPSVTLVDYAVTPDATLTLGNSIPDLIGNGAVNVTYKLTVSSAPSISTTGPISYAIGIDSFSGGTETVTYTYTPSAVPEPASLSIMGVAGLALLRRRR